MNPAISRRLLSFGAAALVSLNAASLRADDLPTKQDDRLIPVFSANRVWNGVTLSTNGRTFVCYPGADGPGVQVEEILPDKHRQYPDEEWNSWKKGRDIAHGFVCVNAVRIGPDGTLWIIDAGAPAPGKPMVSSAGRIIGVDLKSDIVKRIYALDKAVKPDSYVDDIRFNGGHAYITDVGVGGLIVLDLGSGEARRVLDGDKSTLALRPMYADGKITYEKDGTERRSHTDQLEVSPDGKYLYYLPCSGPMARIETRFLDDASLSQTELAGHVEKYLETPTCGGTAIDADGNIYYSDTNKRQILKITPEKEISTLIADPRLQWSDAMWIDKDGFIWMPASQQEFTPGFTGGKQAVNYPVWIYKMQIGAKPAPNDHP